VGDGKFNHDSSIGVLCHKKLSYYAMLLTAASEKLCQLITLFMTKGCLVGELRPAATSVLKLLSWLIMMQYNEPN